MRDGDYHLVIGIKILRIEFSGCIIDLCSAGIAVFLAYFGQFVLDYAAAYFRVIQDEFQAGDKFFDFLILLVEFILLESGELTQTHVNDSLCLSVGKAEPLTQSGLGGLRAISIADNLYNLINMIGGYDETLEYMGAVLGFFKLELSAAYHNFMAVVNECLDEVLEVEQLRAAVNKSHVVDRERRLHGRHLVELVEHYVGIGILTQFYHDAHTLACVRLVVEVGDTVEFLVIYKLGDIFDKLGFVNAVGYLANNYNLMLFLLLDFGFGTHHDASAAGGVRLLDSGIPVYGAAGREVRRRKIVHQPFRVYFRIVNVSQACVDGLRKVMRRHIGGHTYGNTLRAVDKQVGDTGREHYRLLARIVVSRLEVHSVRVDIAEHLLPYFLKAHFSVTHGGRAVTVNGAEVAVAVNKTLPHGPWLRHTHDCAIN